MKILIHFQPKNNDYVFEGARLRKTLKGACESVGVSWVEDLSFAPDIAHFLSPEDVRLLEKAKAKGIKTVVSAGYTEADRKARFYDYPIGKLPLLKMKAKRIVEKADLTLVPDENTKKRFQDAGVKGRFLVLPTAVNIARFEGATPLEKNIFKRYARVKDGDRYVLSSAHLNDKETVDIYKKIAALCPEYRFFVLIGRPKSWLGTLAVWSDQRKAPKNLVFSPLIEDDVYRSALLNASCYLKIGSHYSGEIQILEAFAARTPVIAYGEQENSPLLKNGVNSSFVLSPEEAVNILIRLSDQPESAKVEKAYETAKGRSLPLFGEKLKQIYEDLLNSKEETQHA
ncbi:MAG: glycosyltransferase [Bacilli bacterium]|nr:glycosyltransferase [Bacilli bacterium]